MFWIPAWRWNDEYHVHCRSGNTMTARSARNFFFCLAILALLCAAATPVIHEWIYPSAALTGERGGVAHWSAGIDRFVRQVLIIAVLCIAAGVASLIAGVAAWLANDTRGRMLLMLSPFVLVVLATLYYIATTF